MIKSYKLEINNKNQQILMQKEDTIPGSEPHKKVKIDDQSEKD